MEDADDAADGGEQPDHRRQAVIILTMSARYSAILLAATLMFPGLSPAGESPVPSLNLPDLDNKPHSLSEWHGKTVLLNFWASWCPTCQYEIPDLVRWQEQYGNRQLQVIGIGIDKSAPLGNVARSFEINYPILVVEPPRGPGLLEEWGDPNGLLPYSVIINSAGKIVYRHRGAFTQETFDFEVLPLLSPATETAIAKNRR
jgi:thiol-disulfide isomerase/thioredoxin